MAGSNERTRVLGITVRGKDELSPTMKAILRGVKTFTKVMGGFGKIAALPFTLMKKAASALLSPLGLVSAVISGLALREIGRFVTEATAAGDAIAKLSLKLQIGTTQLQEYQHVAQIAGTSVEQLKTGWATMQKNVSEAARGTGEAVRALRDLGLSARDLRTLKPEEQFEEIARAMGRVTNEADRTRIVMKLFGESGTEALKVFALGADELERLKQEAHELGAVLSPAQLKVYEHLADSFTRWKTALAGVRNQLVAVLGMDIAAWLNKSAAAIAKAGKWMANLARGIRAAFGTDDLAQEAQRILGELGQTVQEMGRRFGRAFIEGLAMSLHVGFGELAPIVFEWSRDSLGRKLVEGLSWAFDQLEKATGGVIVNRLDDILADAVAWEDQSPSEYMIRLRRQSEEAMIAFKDFSAEVFTDLGALGGDVKARLQELTGLGITALERANAALRDVPAPGGGDEADPFSFWAGWAEAGSKAWEEFGDEFSRGKDLFQGITGEIRSGWEGMIDSAVEGTLRLGDAVDQMGRRMLAMISKVVAEQTALFFVQDVLRIGASAAAGGAAAGAGAGAGVSGGTAVLPILGNATGNVFRRAQRIQAFAGGGVVERPTLFAMRRGLGMMGEAGPEAILPLRRGAGGRLGVEASGGGGGGAGPVTVNLHVSAIDTQTGAEFLLKHAEQIGDQVQAQIATKTGMRSAIRGAAKGGR